MINKVSTHINKKGLTLIEVLVSIVLISIIIVTFFSFFIQSAKTGKTSEEVLDATYIAQAEMEKLYEVSRNGDYKYSINEIINNIKYKRLTSTHSDEEEHVEIFEKTVDVFYIQLKLKDHSYPGMSYLVIEVFEGKNGPSKAKMETILEWGS